MKNPDCLLQGERIAYVVLSSPEMGEELNETCWRPRHGWSCGSNQALTCVSFKVQMP